MGLFDNFVPSKEDKQMKEMAKSNQEAALESSTYEAANDVNQEYSSENNQAKMDLLRWQQDMTQDEKGLYMDLLDLVEVDNKLRPRTNSQPLCNEKFITQVVKPTIRPFLSKNMINTTFDGKGIKSMLHYTFDTMADTIADGYHIDDDKGFGIEFCNYDEVIRLLKNFCVSSANRSLGGFTKKHDSSIIKVVEGRTMIDRGQEPRKGIFGFGT